jgi:hypothetical protein
MKRVRVCTTPGCPELQPCQAHSRPANAPWSTGRNTAEHLKLRRYVIKTRGPACERCGQQALDHTGKGLHLHHVKPGNQPASVILLCHSCHKDLDTHAR